MLYGSTHYCIIFGLIIAKLNNEPGTFNKNLLMHIIFDHLGECETTNWFQNHNANDECGIRPEIKEEKNNNNGETFEHVTKGWNKNW